MTFEKGAIGVDRVERIARRPRRPPNFRRIVSSFATEFGIPVCPHAGGVGLCEHVQHLAIFDYIAISASLEDRVVEYVGHLHEHFEDPVIIREGRYVAPTAPGYSITMRPASLERFAFPSGEAWTVTEASAQKA